MHQQRNTPSPQGSVVGDYRCIHLRWGCTRLQLSYKEFFILVRAVNGKRCPIEEENELAEVMAEMYRDVPAMRPIQDHSPEFNGGIMRR